MTSILLPLCPRGRFRHDRIGLFICKCCVTPLVTVPLFLNVLSLDLVVIGTDLSRNHLPLQSGSHLTHPQSVRYLLPSTTTGGLPVLCRLRSFGSLHRRTHRVMTGDSLIRNQILCRKFSGLLDHKNRVVQMYSNLSLFAEVTHLSSLWTIS